MDVVAARKIVEVNGPLSGWAIVGVGGDLWRDGNGEVLICSKRMAAALVDAIDDLTWQRAFCGRFEHTRILAEHARRHGVSLQALRSRLG